MSDVVDISHLHKAFKTDLEKQQFAEAQNRTILELQKNLKLKEDEITTLKKLISETVPLLGEPKVEKVIVSPEEALLDAQILFIQQRSYSDELDLESVKKLDILLKNKKILKEQSKSIEGESKKFIPGNIELLQIVQEHGSK